MMSRRVLVAMSGGVDSAVSAHLLLKQGYHVVSATMLLLPCNKTAGIRNNCCCGEESINAARRISLQLGIPHYVKDISDMFEQKIITRFVNEYSCGRTPNPCVWCNKEIKFGALLEEAHNLGQELIATGHYARIEKDCNTNRLLLKKGSDLKKDQSYFLYSLSQKQLSSILFPLADITKTEIRRIASEIGISSYNTPESQDVCFVSNNNYAQFIKERIGEKQHFGSFRDSSGKILGQHKGIELYTIGQRRRLGISGGEPLYVIKIDAQTGDIVIGSKKEVYSQTLTANNINWITFNKTPDNLRCNAKIRYTHKEAPATVSLLSDESIKITFDEPQLAVTPGQSVVFYEGDCVLGGGTIDSSEENL
ncbi:MAG: tRNA 2-thiouridine(34) synthase MnmA [Planctomycetota bacterium]